MWINKCILSNKNSFFRQNYLFKLKHALVFKNFLNFVSNKEPITTKISNFPKKSRIEIKTIQADYLKNFPQSIKNLNTILTNISHRPKVLLLFKQQEDLARKNGLLTFQEELSKKLLALNINDLKSHGDHLSTLLKLINKIDSKYPQDDLLRHLTKNIIPNFSNLKGDSILQYMTLFRKINIKDNEIWKYLCNELKLNDLNTIPMPNLVNALWILNTISYRDIELYNNLTKILLENRSKELSLHDISLLSLIFSHQMDNKSIKYLEKIFLELDNFQTKINPTARDIATLLWGFSHFFELSESKVYEILFTKYVGPIIKQFRNIKDISMTIFACSKIKENPSKNFQYIIKILISQFNLNCCMVQRESQPNIHCNEQDISNVLFGACLFNFIPDKDIEPIIDLFLSKIEEIKPNGVGYCLKALDTHRKALFNKYEDAIINAALSKKIKFSIHNLGTLSLLFKDMKNPEGARLSESMLQEFIDISLKTPNNQYAMDQIYLAFYTAQQSKILSKYYDQLCHIYLSAPSKKYAECNTLVFSLFMLAFSWHFNYQFPIDNPQFNNMKTTILKNCMEILTTFINTKKFKSKGIGNIIYNMAKLCPIENHVNELILNMISILDFKDLDISEIMNLFRVVDGLSKKDEKMISKIKSKILRLKIKTLDDLENLEDHLKLNKQNFERIFEQELKILISELKNKPQNGNIEDKIE